MLEQYKKTRKYVRLTDEEKEYFVHRSCYFYVPCQRCGTKENITYDDVNNRFYCETCFEEIKKTFRYQRMKRNMTRKYGRTYRVHKKT